MRSEQNIIENILKNRGIEDIEHYLNTTEKDILDPFLLCNMSEAVNLLNEHLCGDGKIYVQVDSDNDGMASSALLLNYLHAIMPKAVEERVYWGIHGGKEHGIDISKITEGTKLVIAPDASSEEFKIHKELKDQGIDVLILDHHNADHFSEYAVVVNNQLDDYPNKCLCGAGVVFKFCQALDQTFNLQLADYFRDLAAWGIIADMINLNNYETRQIIVTGLANIRNPYLSTIIDKNSFSFKDGITPTSIAWSVTPYINAIMRVGEPIEKEVVFESMLDWKGFSDVVSSKRGHKAGETEKLAEQAVRISANVKKRQENELDKIKINITEELNKHKILLIECPSNSNKNLLGLIANKIANEFNKPTILGRVIDGHIVGSARSPGLFAIESFQKACIDSKLVDYAQGHDSAFGISIPEENKEKFLEYMDSLLKDVSDASFYKVDYIFSNINFESNDIITLAHMKSVWGQGIPEPLIAVTHVPVSITNAQLLSPDKHPTLKIILDNKVECIKFKSSLEEFNKLVEKGVTFIDLVGSCAINEWNFLQTPQILIKDYNIINSQQYYF